MKFLCPKCGRAVLTLASRQCPDPECGFRIALVPLCQFYWRKLIALRPRPVLVQCPHCQRASPISAPSCPHCHQAITINETVAKAVAPLRANLEKPTPRFIKRLQWIYLLISVIVFAVALTRFRFPDVGVFGLIVEVWALESLFYFALIIVLITWLLGRFKKSRKPLANRVRLALVFNSLTLMMALFWAVVSWPILGRLALVLLIVMFGLLTLVKDLWPLQDKIREALDKRLPPNEDSFDHTKRQGRKGDFD